MKSLERQGTFTKGNLSIFQKFLLDFLLFVEEDEKEDYKIESFKATILQSFPSKEMYEQLYGEKKDENEPWIDAIPESNEEYMDLLELLKESSWADEDEIGYGH